jgi:hypothetical protein
MMVIVGFQSRVGMSGLGWLKKGYRHCFGYQRTDRGWVLCDPVSDGLLLQSAPDLSARTLLCAMAAVGASVVAFESKRARPPMPWLRPITCVEICKRLAGCRCTWLLTPHQLYRNLLMQQIGIDAGAF